MEPYYPSTLQERFTMDKTTCKLVAVVLCLAMTASSYLVPDSRRIIGGSPISIEEVPWQVSFVNTSGGHYCGGSIISEKFIITAAHCVRKGPEKIWIRTGSSMREEGGVLLNVARVIQHELYGETKPRNDIGLAELSEPLEFGPGTAPISLANQDEQLFEGEWIHVTGWGYVIETGPQSDILLEAIIPIHNQEECLVLNDDDDCFCAGNLEAPNGACKGDSGGPAVLNGILVGLVRSGFGKCTTIETPGEFTRISAFRDWIDMNAV